MKKFKVEMKFSRGWDVVLINVSKQEAENFINKTISRSCYLLKKDFRIIKH